MPGDKGSGAAGIHGFAGRALGDLRGSVGDIGGDRNRSALGIGGTVFIAEAAVNLPAVERLGHVLKGQVLGIAVDDLHGRELRRSLLVIQVAGTVGTYEVPFGQVGVFVLCDELGAAVHGNGFTGRALGHAG